MAVRETGRADGVIRYRPFRKSEDAAYDIDISGSGGSGPGGVGGGGSVWSDSEQLIWISINDAPKYPVWLQAGWNDIQFWIPFIFPDDEWIEAPLIIEAPGYILIPAGFEIYIKTSEDAPVRTANPKMTDKLKFIDVYDIEIESVPVPVDLDGLMEEIVFEDTHSIDIIAISNIVDESCIDNLTIEDIYNVEIEAEPFSGEYEHVDEVIFDDVTKTELINTTIINSNNIADISFMDIESSSTVNATVNNQTESESIGFDDFVDID